MGPASHPALGAAAALGSALAWAIGSILFRRIGERASPAVMNLAKCLIGLVMLGVVILVTGISPLPPGALLGIAASGVLGIAIGDTLFFMALVRLEPRLTLLLSTVGQVLTVVLAVALLGEQPTPRQLVGIPLVLGGVTWVLFEREAGAVEAPGGGRARRLAGIAWGLASALATAAALLLAKVAVADASALEATWIRLAAGLGGVLVGAAFRGRLGADLRAVADPALLKSLVGAVFVVMFGGFWLSLVALQHADATIVTALTATEPIFILPLAAFALGERISARAIAGAVVAVAGTVLIVG